MAVEQESVNSGLAPPSAAVSCQTVVEGNVETTQQQDMQAESEMATPPRARGRSASRGPVRPTTEVYRPPGYPSAGDILMSSRGRGHPRPLSAALGICEPPAQRSASATHLASPLTADSWRVQDAAVPDWSPEMSPRSSAGEEAEIKGESAPIEFSSLLGQVLSDPTSLVRDELERHALGIFLIACKTVDYAGPAARFCADLVVRVTDGAFLEELLALCIDAFNERKEAPLAVCAKALPLNWLPFVAFLVELLVLLRSYGSGQVVGVHFVAVCNPATTFTRNIAALLCDCCVALLSSSSLGSDDEVESLRAALTAAGKDMEREVPKQVQEVFSTMRKAFVRPGLSAGARLALLEMLELHASGWHLDEVQAEYYCSRSSALVDFEG